MPAPADPLLTRVAAYYTERYLEHGATARGVDWNGAESQELRFSQLLRITDDRDPFSVVDYGCGYGALASFLGRSGRRFDYVGYDVSAPLLEQARLEHGDAPHCTFVDTDGGLVSADFAVASGIFNVKLDISRERWEKYVLATLDRLDELGVVGFAFNVLTSHSDVERMRPDLYYGDPTLFFDHCVRRYARHVAILHDYGLYEFTVLVRKQVSP